MEGNDSILNSSYYRNNNSNGVFSSNPTHHYTNTSNNSSHFTSMDTSSPTTSTIFPPHSVTGRAPAPAPALETMVIRRKRGRPRKYGPPQPTVEVQGQTGSREVKKEGSVKKKEVAGSFGSGYSKKSQLAGLGNAGQGFTSHIITVEVGEDVAHKIMTFMQQRKRGVCILSASGAVSVASLRQPASLGGNVTYEGRFEILSLSGSFLHSDIGGSSSRTGGLSVCLSGTDGRIVGGGVGGPLKAAGPVQVIVGSFVIDNNTKDVGAEAKVEAISSKLPQHLAGASNSNVSFRPLLEPVRGNDTSISSVGFHSLPESRVDKNNQNFGGNFMFQSRGMNLIPSGLADWRVGMDARGSGNIELTGRTQHIAPESPEDGD